MMCSLSLSSSTPTTMAICSKVKYSPMAAATAGVLATKSGLVFTGDQQEGLGGRDGRRDIMNYQYRNLFRPEDYRRSAALYRRLREENQRLRVEALQVTETDVENVRLRQVDNVDVIANAGAVGSWIIGPENFAMRRLPERHLLLHRPLLPARDDQPVGDLLRYR